MKQKSVITILLLSILFAMCAYPFLPQRIPIHWNVQGFIDGRAPKIAVFTLPILMLLLIWLFDFTQFIDPKKENYKKFSQAIHIMKLAVCLFLLCLQIVTIGSSIHEHLINVPLLLHMGFGILFVVLGNLMPKIRPNYFIGIKTPWALANEDNWRITHRFAGRIWFACGLLIIPCALLPTTIAGNLIIIIVIGICIIPCAYSYVIFRKKEKEEKTYDRN